MSFIKATGPGVIGCLPSVNFINILSTPFTCADPKRAKNKVKTSAFIALLGSACVKTVPKMLVKSTPNLPNLNWFILDRREIF
jgi:hypothetical protein